MTKPAPEHSPADPDDTGLAEPRQRLPCLGCRGVVDDLHLRVGGIRVADEGVVSAPVNTSTRTASSSA